MARCCRLAGVLSSHGGCVLCMASGEQAGGRGTTGRVARIQSAGMTHSGAGLIGSEDAHGPGAGGCRLAHLRWHHAGGRPHVATAPVRDQQRADETDRTRDETARPKAMKERLRIIRELRDGPGVPGRRAVRGTAPHLALCDDSARGRPEGVAADEAQQPGLGSGVLGHLDPGPVLAGGVHGLLELLHARQQSAAEVGVQPATPITRAECGEPGALTRRCLGNVNPRSGLRRYP